MPSGCGLPKSQGTLNEFWSILVRAHAAVATWPSLLHSLLGKTMDSLARGSYKSQGELSLHHSCAWAGRMRAETTLVVFQRSDWVTVVLSAALTTYGVEDSPRGIRALSNPLDF